MLIPYKDRIMDKLKMSKSSHRFTLSAYYGRSLKLVQFKKPSFTETVVGLDEREEEEEEEEGREEEVGRGEENSLGSENADF